MLPTLRPGDEILFNPYAYQLRSPEPGELVVAHHPKKKLQLIKRVAEVLDNGDCWLLGDNSAESTDSREFGAVPRQLLIGHVICQIPSLQSEFFTGLATAIKTWIRNKLEH